MSILTKIHVLTRLGRLTTHIQRRFRHRQKKKWAKSDPVKAPTDLAMDYFDSFYKPVYGALWPSIRVSLLSRQKYGALLNSFVPTGATVEDLASDGAADIVERARSTEFSYAYYSKQKKIEEKLQNASSSEERVEQEPVREVDRTDLSYFMPTTKIISEREDLMNQELQQAFIESRPSLHIIPDIDVIFPNHLKMFTHERGHIASFSPAKLINASKLNYYLMDASSILPVLALNLRPGDSVIDMCAAPGGKTLAMLQTSLLEKLVCVDNSYDRVRRLQEVLRLYTPPSLVEQNKVQVLHTNALRLAQRLQDSGITYDKALVDVPCYTDRHVLHEDENNLFQRSRQRERLQIQDTQRKLLMAALQCVKPGGTVVYSTCTLSMPQNDGVVQTAIDAIHETTDDHIVIVDTSGIADKFRDTFNFYSKCHYGQLVLPYLTANFGPLYFCKMVKCPK